MGVCIKKNSDVLDAKGVKQKNNDNLIFNFEETCIFEE